MDTLREAIGLVLIHGTPDLPASDDVDRVLDAIAERVTALTADAIRAELRTLRLSRVETLERELAFLRQATA